MAWISFVIVVSIFVLGLDRLIPHHPFAVTVPLLRVSFNIPYSGYLRMFFLTLVIWLVLWWILSLLEDRFNLLRKSGLRNGMMYATRPRLVNYVAVVIAGSALVVTAVRFALDSFRQILTARALGSVIGLITGSLRAGGLERALDLGLANLPVGGGLGVPGPVPNLPILHILPILVNRGQPTLPTPILPRSIIVLCLLTLIAAFAFGQEQRRRYEKEVRRGQICRKQSQDEITIPSSGR